MSKLQEERRDRIFNDASSFLEKLSEDLKLFRKRYGDDVSSDLLMDIDDMFARWIEENDF